MRGRTAQMHGSRLWARWNLHSGPSACESHACKTYEKYFVTHVNFRAGNSSNDSTMHLFSGLLFPQRRSGNLGAFRCFTSIIPVSHAAARRATWYDFKQTSRRDDRAFARTTSCQCGAVCRCAFLLADIVRVELPALLALRDPPPPSCVIRPKIDAWKGTSERTELDHGGPSACEADVMPLHHVPRDCNNARQFICHPSCTRRLAQKLFLSAGLR